MNTKALYVHIPFCEHICSYCDFTRYMYNRAISDTFMMRLLAQIHKLENTYTSIYVGGGTPTALQSDQLESLLEALAEKLDREDYEWTFEANPESLSPEKIALMKDYGVNRISLGVQTSDNQLLREIGRYHSFEQVREAADHLRKGGIDNFSMDLMYGLPHQSLASFEKSMRDIISLRPNHVSIYALILEPNSLFGKEHIKTVSSDVETEMYLRCIALMSEHAYHHYEISNFALAGKESRHNKVYWHYENYDALGPGASMKIDRTRKTWTRSMVKYLREDGFDEILHLSEEEAMFEFIMMGLRLKEGICLKRFKKTFHRDLLEVYPEAVRKSQAQGLLLIDEKRIAASPEGFIMLDDILLNFMD